MAEKNDKTRQIFDAAVRNNLIDGNASVQKLMNDLGGDVAELGGYVLAWDRYVLVIKGEDTIEPAFH